MEKLDLQKLELIYQSNRSQVYRGKQKNNKPVVLKLMALDEPSIHELAQLKQEHNILAKLDHEGIIKSYGISIVAGRTALMLEDFGGTSLAQVLAKKTLPLDIALDIAIKVCEALAILHQQNIIHKDINPSNIVWNEVSGEVKIIDFNMSTTLSRELVEFKSPNVLEGTLPYISPEQTGRMNRAVDYRSDLYSFGATLYHLLTGQLPFEEEEEICFVHAHIAKESLPPHQINSDLPVILSKIVLKLLAKNAEDRYQSSLGLKRDLERCFQKWQATKNISAFTIAENDVPNKLRLPQKLYGREKEIQKLLNSFENVNQTGQAEVLVVAGYAGVGKTTLVQEVYKPITESKGYFISGKFDQLQRDIPYIGFVKAFEELIRQFLSESAEELANWKKKLLEVLGNNAGVITEIVPSLEKVIGEQSKATRLPPEQTKNRFNLVFQNFVSALATPKHHLTIFLDDLQWADYASLELIEEIYLRSDDKSLLFIGAYRDNEVSSTHKLNDTLKKMKENGAIIHVVDLKPLETKDLEKMLTNALYTKGVKSLAKLLEKHTQGNPYFIGEFLKELYVKEALYFKNGSWRWDVEQIESQGYTDNIVELMLGKIKALHQNTKELLTKAACIGSTFDLTTLSVVSEQSQEQILEDLQIALEQDLLLRRKELYIFAHDRVQQAAYNLIPEDTKPAIHLDIGKHLLAATSEEKLETNIFSIVDQMNAGLELLISQQEKDKLAELNLKAGKRARTSAAYKLALAYLRTALKLLGEDCWSRRYELSLTTHEEAAEVANVDENYKLFDSLFDVTVRSAKTTLDKVNIYITKISALSKQDKLQQAIDNGLSILKELDCNLPARPNHFHVLTALLRIYLFLKGKNIPKLVDLPQASDPKIVAILKVCDALHEPCGLKASHFLIVMLLQVQIIKQLKYGHYSALPYIAMAWVLLTKLNKIEMGQELAKLALDLNLIPPYSEINPNVTKHIFYTSVAPWKEHSKQAALKLEQNYNDALQRGYFDYAIVSLSTEHYFKFLGGEPLDELEHYFQSISKTIVKSNLSSRNAISHPFNIVGQVTLNLLSDPDEIFTLKGSIFDEINLSLEESPFSMFCLYLIKLKLAYIFDKYSKAIVFAKSVEETMEAMPSIVGFAAGNFYSSLAKLAMFEKTRQRKLLTQVVKNQKKMEFWAKHGPMNYLHKWHLVEAEKYRLLGKDSKAWYHYKKAIKGARENNYVNEEAIALELTARYFLRKEDEELAGHYMRQSYGAYARWGATAKLTHLKENYPELLIEPLNFNISSFTTKSTNAYESSKTKHSELDMASLIRASHTLSSELELNTLISQLMKILLENAGAHQSFLLLPQNEEAWTVVAYCSVDKEVSLENIPLEDAKNNLPISLIRFVIRTREHIVLSNASESDYQQDSYIKLNKPKSVMSLPLMYQGNLVGVVYLENNLAVGAFSEDRVELLTLLSTQAAISLQNASLLSEVKDKVTQLELSRKRLVQIDEERRRGLAERLHSTVQSKLLSAKLELKSSIKKLPEEEVKKEVERVCGVLEQIQEQDLSQVSYLLHPTIVRTGLIPAIESFLEELSAPFKIKWSYDETVAKLDSPRNKKIPEEIRLTVYRVLEEALLNIKKHAEASLVKILLSCQENDLLFEVSDNGSGFDEDKMQPHLGLHSIDDRVSLVKGSWKITSKINQGTTLQVQLPLL